MLTLACGGDSPGASGSRPPIGPARAFVWPDDSAGTREVAVLHVRHFGDIEIALYPELAPEAVANFQKLAESGFYEGTTFHRVIPGLIIQGGDPYSKDKDPYNDGSGGPDYVLPLETSAAPQVRGVVSMAFQDRGEANGSQFFIVHEDARHLDGAHAVFGRVISGMEVVDAITAVEIDTHGRWGPKDRPLEKVVIDGLEIHEAAMLGSEMEAEAGSPDAPQNEPGGSTAAPAAPAPR